MRDLHTDARRIYPQHDPYNYRTLTAKSLGHHPLYRSRDNHGASRYTWGATIRKPSNGAFLYLAERAGLFTSRPRSSSAAATRAADYERHRPEETPLHGIVETYDPQFLARLEAEGGSLPAFVKQEFDD